MVYRSKQTDPHLFYFLVAVHEATGIERRGRPAAAAATVLPCELCALLMIIALLVLDYGSLLSRGIIFSSTCCATNNLRVVCI